MPDADNALLRATLKTLFAESDLEVDDATLDQVIGLHRHFNANRARLSAAELGETEPATVYSVDAVGQGRDRERQ